MPASLAVVFLRIVCRGGRRNNCSRYCTRTRTRTVRYQYSYCTCTSTSLLRNGMNTAVLYEYSYALAARVAGILALVRVLYCTEQACVIRASGTRSRKTFIFSVSLPVSLLLCLSPCLSLSRSLSLPPSLPLLSVSLSPCPCPSLSLRLCLSLSLSISQEQQQQPSRADIVGDRARRVLVLIHVLLLVLLRFRGPGARGRVPRAGRQQVEDPVARGDTRAKGWP